MSILIIPIKTNCSFCILIFFSIFNKNEVGQFAEDGSFIGQYVPGKLQPPVSPPSTHQMQSLSSSKQQLPNGSGNIGNSSGAIATYV